jgi:branched-chain amino acid transport system permease protein
VKWIVYLAAAAWAGMAGALIFITKLRIAPEAAFSIDWTTTIFFVVVIGGIGTIEGPILGTLAFFILRGLLADYGSWYLVALGAVAVVFMVWIPSGLWGMISRGTGLRLFPVQRHAPSVLGQSKS